MKIANLTCFLALFLSSLTACTRQQDSSPAKPVPVTATKAYGKYFGPAPLTEKGSCYAFVIYFPSAKAPAKVVPLPFFSFDETSLKNVAVQRLVGGMAGVKSYQGEISQPFPPGAHLLGLKEKDGVLTVNFSKEVLAAQPDAASERALANAVTLTLSQFSGVNEVRIQVDGTGSRLDKLVHAGDEHDVLPLAAPRLLGITAMRDKGAQKVEEVDAFFDRPVEIKVLEMAGADGRPFQGDIYQSVFDMAGVLKPKDSGLFQAGMPIKVRWEVTDKLGRRSSGEDEIILEIKEH